MQIRYFRTPDVFDELHDEWNQLLQNSVHNLIFLTHEWQKTWWEAYHPGELWMLAVYNDQQELVAIAPWFIENRKKTGRTVRSVGCVDVTDYLEIILHKAYVNESLSALADYLAEHQTLYDCVDWCNVPENSPVLTYFPQLLESKGMTIEIKQQEVCPVIELPDNWEAYLELLDKKQRHELRRKMRRADGSGQEITWYIVGQEHHLDDEIEKFLRLMALASEEKAQFLQNPQHVQFFRQMVKVIAAQGWLQLAFLLVDNEYATAYINFIYGNEVLVYNSGLDLNVGSALSPGILLLANLIQHAIEHRYNKFDFLRGDEHYKYRMGAKDTRVFMLHATFAPSSDQNGIVE